ncbi:threonine/serine exporter family protein [Lactobacillus sp. ESL0731]|uniref:threonine/serine exporter family protein n=1 Tax=unclassified Lactobacillus TaxID=2620435 RepID=UPI0023F69576|nr:MULTISPECIES: threonine/serine exporter family protein [unclassified Lactobacillus]WEV51835.1 threonine/serine exporter family protein [Lactobacillus sp. ESL0700]WEV62965.1 threonine/serine exporter family protein [Lactobacillus sp. ESL0731]
MTFYHFIIQVLFSYLGTVMFDLFINLPKNALNASGGIACVGWLVYWFMFEFGLGSILANFVAAFVVGSLGIIFAVKKKMPSTMFVSGLVPLVPGASGYEALAAMINHSPMIAVQKTIHVAMVAGAIALGYVFSQVVVELMHRKRR